MADPIVNRLRGLILSAAELQAMTDWPDSLIEDYLNILDSLFSLAETLNLNTIYQDGSIIFSKNDILIEDNPAFTWDNVTKVLSALNIKVPSLTPESVLYVDDDNLLAEDNPDFTWDSAAKILNVNGVITNARVPTKVVDSNYTILTEDGVIYADTDGGDITLTLEGIDGETHRIVNVGSSGNICILTSTNNINGSSDDEPIYDSENFDITYQLAEGWF